MTETFYFKAQDLMFQKGLTFIMQMQVLIRGWGGNLCRLQVSRPPNEALLVLIYIFPFTFSHFAWPTISLKFQVQTISNIASLSTNLPNAN